MVFKIAFYIKLKTLYRSGLYKVLRSDITNTAFVYILEMHYTIDQVKKKLNGLVFSIVG